MLITSTAVPADAGINEFTLTIAAQFPYSCIVSGQISYDHFAGGAQTRNFGVKDRTTGGGRENTTAFLARRQHTYQLPHVYRKSRRGTRTAESFANLVVTTAKRNRIGQTRAVSGKNHAAVIVVAAQVGKIYCNRNAIGNGERTQIS